jgi:gliding motility-associated-like protein
LDISKNTFLSELYCNENLLKSINLTKNSKLSRLYVGNNQISYLNVAYNPKLTDLNVENNPLTSLYLVQNPLLVNFNGQYNPLLSSVCASPTQNTSAWVKDSATVINTTCTRANDNKLLADNFSLDKGETDKFLNVLANDNAVSLQTLYIDLMPDSAGIQQELTTNAGTFTVKNQNQLYFSPSDTVGDVTVKYMLIDSAGIITSNTTTIDLAVKSKLKFYSGFSPNGDNVNANFHITYVRPNSTVKLNVYDMNGFVVYTNDNYDNKWDGLDNDGKKLANGTYYYIVQYQENSTADVVQYNGFVEIKY